MSNGFGFVGKRRCMHYSTYRVYSQWNCLFGMSHRVHNRWPRRIVYAVSSGSRNEWAGWRVRTVSIRNEFNGKRRSVLFRASRRVYLERNEFHGVSCWANNRWKRWCVHTMSCRLFNPARWRYMRPVSERV
jgi:hypothetical protein